MESVRFHLDMKIFQCTVVLPDESKIFCITVTGTLIGLSSSLKLGGKRLIHRQSDNVWRLLTRVGFSLLPNVCLHLLTQLTKRRGLLLTVVVCRCFFILSFSRLKSYLSLACFSMHYLTCSVPAWLLDKKRKSVQSKYNDKIKINEWFNLEKFQWLCSNPQE